MCSMSDINALQALGKHLGTVTRTRHDSKCEVPAREFPGSGALLPPTWSHAEADGLLVTCMSNPPSPERLL